MNKYTVLPLLNSSFEPGKALETVEQFEDKDFRNIAMAELYYFTGKAKECCEITELYLENEKMELRLSACMLYCYANLTLGRSVASKRGLQGIQECISKAMKKRFRRNCRHLVYWQDMLVRCFFIFQQREFRRCGNTVAFFLRG